MSQDSPLEHHIHAEFLARIHRPTLLLAEGAFEKRKCLEVEVRNLTENLYRVTIWPAAELNVSLTPRSHEKSERISVVVFRQPRVGGPTIAGQFGRRVLVQSH